MKNLILITFTLSLTSCFFGEKDIGTSLKGTTGTISNSSIASEEELFSVTGQKNYEQIIATISQDTGVTQLTTGERREAVANAISTLPDNHALARFNDAAQKSVFQVASAYCDQMVATADIRNSVFPDIGNMGDDLSDAEKQHIIDVIAERFWGGTAAPETIEMLKSQLDMMLSEFRDDGLPKSSLVFGACTYASSTANKVFN